MKDILLLMAQYNQTVNSRLYDLLSKSDQKLLIRKTGSYFNNIIGLLNHLLLTDLGWLSAYRDSNLNLPSLQSPLLEHQNPGWGKNLYHNLPDLKNHQENIDSLIVEFVSETSIRLFLGDIEVTRHSGEVHSFPFGKLLMHLFNHQTHHRGAIAQILDENGLENDYSNLIGLLMKEAAADSET